MFGKISTVAILVSLAIAVQGTSLHGSVHNVNVAPLYIQERQIEVPSFSAVLLKGAKIVFSLLKPGWSVIGFKVGALALIANVIIWGIKHGLFIILGAVSVIGFCKFTGKCSTDHIPKPVFDFGDTLLYAARQLQNGAELYNNEILY